MKKRGRPKLNEKLVKEILTFKANNSHQTGLFIAKKFGVHRTTISRIFNNSDNKEEIKRLKARKSWWVELDNNVFKSIKIYAIKNDIENCEAIEQMIIAGLRIHGVETQ